MNSVLNRRVLVLNRSWIPINTTTVFNALISCFNERANFIDPDTFCVHSWESWVESWEDAVACSKVEADRIIHCPSCSIVAPEVIVATEYRGMGFGVKHNGRPKFSRKNIFARDKNVCQFCGKRFQPHELNIDHVVPRSKGGRTEWTNVVLSCVRCNDKKRDRTPKEAGMKMMRRPFVPSADDLCLSFSERLRRKIRGKVPKSWTEFLGKMYWNVELEKS
jgi:hypothetical protein